MSPATTPSPTNSVRDADLPLDLSPEEAVALAYPAELAGIVERLQQGLSVLVECAKDLTPWVFLSVRGLLRAGNLDCVYLDGRLTAEDCRTLPPISAMLRQMLEVVRGSVDRRVLVVPHLDLLVGWQGDLSPEGRQAVPLFYENPELPWLGFKDQSLPLPQVVGNLFYARVGLAGVSASRLRHLITAREARKFGATVDIDTLARLTAGCHAVRLRTILARIDGEDYPTSPDHAYDQVRRLVLAGQIGVPAT